MSVNPSSPASDSSKTASRPGLSKKAKFWIGLSLAVIIPTLAALIAYRIYLSLLPDNPRLVVRKVLIAGYFTSGDYSAYWNPTDGNELQERIDYISSILRIQPGKTQLFSNKKDYSLSAMSGKLRQEIPELERVNVRRVIPDQLVFELFEREPVANLGKDYYISKDGTVLSKAVYKDMSLPTIVCNPASVRTTDDGTPFRRGENLSSSAIRTALDFISLVRLKYTDIQLTHVIFLVKEEKCIQCDLLYKNDKAPFSVLVPIQNRSNEASFQDDIFGRLIPKLEESVRNHDDERILDLRFANRIVVKKRQ